MILMKIKQKSIYLFSIAFIIFSLFIGITSFLIPPIWGKYPWLFVLPNGKFNISIAQTLALLLFAVIAILFYLGLYRIFSYISLAWSKIVAGSLFVILMLMEIFVIVQFHGMRPPAIDGGHIYVESLQLLQHGTFGKNQYYLQLYPNNLGITVARYLIYRFLSFGNPANYMLVDKLVTALCLNIGIFFSWLLMIRMFNYKWGNLLLVLTITCFPLILYIPYFYTESLALMFPSMLIYLWYKYIKKKKPIYLIIFGLALGISCQLRENMILIIPALIIYMLYTLQLKKVIMCMVMIAIAFIPVTYGAEAYYKHLGYHVDESIKAPVTHWMALGVAPQGKYNGRDLSLSLEQKTQQKKKQVDIALIKKRIKDRGPAGLIRLWAIKTIRTFSVGDQQYANYAMNPEKFTTTYRYIFGTHRQMLFFIIQFFHAASFILLTFSGLRFFRKKKYDINLLNQITLFGSFLFFAVLWETQSRYSLLFTPLTLIGAVFGLHELNVILEQKLFPKILKEKVKTFTQLLLVGILLILIVVCGTMNYKNLTQTKQAYQDYVVKQNWINGNHYAKVDSQHIAIQTFVAKKSFNNIYFKPVQFLGNANYQLSVIVKNGDKEKTVYSETFRNTTNFVLKKKLPGENKCYKLRIEWLNGSQNSNLLIYVNGLGTKFEPVEMYNEGYFYQNGRLVPKTDLVFSVFKIVNSPYMKSSVYCVLLLLSVLMLAVYAWSIKFTIKSEVSKDSI
ncbi:glycosyltransferase family 39 protein [Heyndrickxia coagulans]|uniref:glycosyltransferase family 39 protein n=1 Tax=Heyndrickxia coagulans TaxID=1398 RepID=UPI001C52ABEF|nr:glycosyltransferase family 39 protein [Heyndrickxia coagulans]